MSGLDIDERRLMTLVTEGDEQAFVELYRSTQPKIYRFALQMTGSSACAEETVQEVYMTLIRHPERYDEARGALTAYLYGIARNIVRRILSDRQAVEACVRRDAEQRVQSVVDQETPFAAISRKELVRRVREAVLQLPEAYREIIVLCELQELSYSAAASIVGCRTGTVRSRLHRGRALLTRKLMNGAVKRLGYGTEEVVRGLL
jgi:RNA polymerase sigma-70 factor (ECF subfamily)